MDNLHPGIRRFIQRIQEKLVSADLEVYEVKPLTCPKCQGRMKIIAFI